MMTTPFDDLAGADSAADTTNASLDPSYKRAFGAESTTEEVLAGIDLSGKRAL
jgi:hypothetical protein